MNPYVKTFFDLTRIRITKQHIIDYSPNDPGYPSYGRQWNEVLRSGNIPTKSNFEFSEVIGLTGWVSLDKLPVPEG